MILLSHYPVRIFIGTDPSQRLAAKVLAYTLQKHASCQLEIHAMESCPIPDLNGLFEKYQRTGFSLYRFAVPELVGYQGKAIYLDADMQVFGDIAELWNFPMQAKSAVLCSSSNLTPRGWQGKSLFHPGRQMSVMLLDCAQLKWNLRDIAGDLAQKKTTYDDLMFGSYLISKNEIDETLPLEWNHLETYVPKQTKLLHYTVGHEQPWLNNRNPLRNIWLNDFREALQKGAISKKEVMASVCEGYAKPCLLKEIQGLNGIDQSKIYFLYLWRRLRRACLKRFWAQRA